MSDPSRHFRVRALLAASAIAVTTLGVGQAIGTSAASTDAVTATSGSLAAAANVLPASDTTWCDAIKNGTYLLIDNWESQISIKHVNKAFDYKMFVLQENNAVAYQQVLNASSAAVGAQLKFPSVGGNQVGRHTAWDYTARVYSINRATGEFSGNWIGFKLRQPTVYQVNCNGQTSGTDAPPNTIRTNSIQALAGPVGDAAASRMSPQLRSAPTPTTDPPAPTATAATTTQTPTVTEPSAETAKPTATTATPTQKSAAAEPAVTGASTTEPSTEKPTPTTSVAAAEPVNTSVPLGKGLTATLTSDGGNTQVVVSNGSGEVCRANVSPAERILTPEGDGTLSVTGNGGVRNIDTATCSIS